MDSVLSLIQWIRRNPEAWAWILPGSVALVVIYAGVILLAVVRMSPDYFRAASPAPGTLRRRHPLLIPLVKGLKTILGLLLILAGIGMLVLPGQGLVTVAIGLSFLEFPGKRHLLRTIVFRGGVVKPLNRIREKAGKEPFLEPENGRTGTRGGASNK